ncbi:flagellar basal body P-ring formation chaperone FlgA [Afifella sp. IM 167]|uniref:flagellar basal body P-ring formation chaperone FlgA n=1 Tax=Afifella sp. IM 167 TaxID=2033586 RepID=UPI001CCED9B1|nr:flagellar basal body P-ring formation chaperone FlgA [Afifella sp. IM 167]
MGAVGESLRRASSLARAARAAVFAFLLAIGAQGASAQQVVQPEYDLLPVPNVTIFPGNVIRAEMLHELHFLPNTRSRFPIVVDVQDLVGKVAKRTLVADRLIPTNAVSEPELVSRGALTTARYDASGLSMTAGVVALESGYLGQIVRVRNIDSGKVIAGVVEADGTVRVGLQ